MVLFQTVAIHCPLTFYKCSMNPDRTPYHGGHGYGSLAIQYYGY